MRAPTLLGALWDGRHLGGSVPKVAVEHSEIRLGLVVAQHKVNRDAVWLRADGDFDLGQNAKGERASDAGVCCVCCVCVCAYA